MATGARQAPSRRVHGRVRFNVLGPLTVTERASTLNIGGPKQRTVLAMLIANLGRPVSADLLVDAVYGEEAGPRSRRTIQTFVSTLRGELGDTIAKTVGGWRLTAGSGDVDAQRFEAMADEARSSLERAPQRAATLLREALSMWNGRPYSDVEAHGHLDAETARLAELRVAAQALRIDADLASGRHGDLVGEIETLLVEHPYKEHFWAQHMLALYRSGRQQEALASYQRMRSRLAEELGIDPSTELQDLEQRILEQDTTLSTSTARTIQRKAILVADPGDPVELADLRGDARDTLVNRASDVIEKVVGSIPGAEIHPAGTAAYAVFDDSVS